MNQPITMPLRKTQYEEKGKKRRKLEAEQQKGYNNREKSISGDDDENKLDGIIHIANESILAPPGAPIAQSTPTAASSRSAFSMLQPLVPIQAHQQFVPASNPHGYFFTPPPETIPVLPHPYQHQQWMRWQHGSMGMPHWVHPHVGGVPMGIGVSKIEPIEMAVPPPTNAQRKTRTSASKAPKRTAIVLEESLKKEDEEEQPNQEADSGLGPDETDANSIDDVPMPIVDIPIPLPFIPLQPINSFETYCTVPGRLTLLSNLKKYRVSIAEIQRRLAPPECLNASILGGILRKAKNKDGGKLLREQLLTYGVELASGRRKQGPLTCFSSMVEEEAAQLARDFELISQNNYPVKDAAALALNEVQNSQDASLSRLELYYASKFLNRILDFHKADRSPVADQQPIDGTAAELTPEMQAGLTNFSLLTHGFGGRIVQSVLESMNSVVNECNTVLNRNYQPSASSSGGQQPSAPMGFKF